MGWLVRVAERFLAWVDGLPYLAASGLSTLAFVLVVAMFVPLLVWYLLARMRVEVLGRARAAWMLAGVSAALAVVFGLLFAAGLGYVRRQYGLPPRAPSYSRPYAAFATLPLLASGAAAALSVAAARVAIRARAWRRRERETRRMAA